LLLSFFRIFFWGNYRKLPSPVGFTTGDTLTIFQGSFLSYKLIFFPFQAPTTESREHRTKSSCSWWKFRQCFVNTASIV